jgi:hypothetical protein
MSIAATDAPDRINEVVVYFLRLGAGTPVISLSMHSKLSWSARLPRPFPGA